MASEIKSSYHISVIIPTFNRNESLYKCISSFNLQTYPHDLITIIVVDDGSEIPILESDLKSLTDIAITVIQTQNNGPATARNIGASKAIGPLIAFTDDDCIPADNWLTKLAAVHQLYPESMIGGKTFNGLVENKYSATSQLITDIVYSHYNKDPNKAYFFASNNMLMPLGIFNKIGGFSKNWRFGEDRELCDRWAFHNYTMIYSDKAIIYHYHNLNFSSFIKQHFGYGRGAYFFHKVRKERKSGSILSETKFHLNLDNWLFVPFKGNVKHRIKLSFLLIVWQVINLLGFLYAFKNDKL